tara:strand:+ start:121 stop:324 length:204 start_codon:yes stop_codon:yes gene_type:complete
MSKIYKDLTYKEAKKIMDKVKQIDDRSIWVRFEHMQCEDGYYAQIVFQYDSDDGWMQYHFYHKKSNQ